MDNDLKTGALHNIEMLADFAIQHDMRADLVAELTAQVELYMRFGASPLTGACRDWLLSPRKSMAVRLLAAVRTVVGE